jgi:hypothetical protein
VLALLALSGNATCDEGNKAVIEEIEETTVGMLNGHRVPMGNMIRETDYTLTDGTKKRGMVCSLVIDGKTGIFVGLGSVVSVGEDKWEIVAIEKAMGELGSVQLKLLQ